MPAFVAGVALQLQRSELAGWPVAWAWTLAGGLGCYLARSLAAGRRERVAPWITSLLMAMSACALGLGLTDLRAQAFAGRSLNPDLEGQLLRVTGVIAAMVQPDEVSTRFRFEPEQAELDGKPVRLPELLELGWYANPPTLAAQDAASLLADWSGSQRAVAPLAPGERWQFQVRLKAPHGSLNPLGYDMELALWEQGVQGSGYVRAGPRDQAPERMGQTWAHPVEWFRQNVRDAILARIPERRMAGLVAALVVGDQRAIERADWDVFRATGVAHLMSISGLHITMFAWLAAAGINTLWRRSQRLCLAFPAPDASLLGGLVLAGAYAVFSGWGIPSQRTVLMLATLTMLRLTGRRWPWQAVWMLTCAVVVAFDPWALLQAGFWLSFVAVGMLYATDSGGRTHATGANMNETAAQGGQEGQERQVGHAAALARRGWLRARSALLGMLREQGVITLALAPLSLLLFGQLSLVSLAANALAIPWVTLVVTPLGMLGLIVPSLWEAAAWALQLLTQGLALMAEWPWAAWFVARAPLWAGLLGLCGALALTLHWPLALRLTGLPLLLPVLFWQTPGPPAGEFELLAADIGQGNAVLIRTERHALLYDAGPRFSADSDAGHRVIVPLLRAWGVRLDALVLSHRDTDHTGGAAAVLAQQPQARLITSMSHTDHLRPPSQVERCIAGERWTWDGVDFEWLHPKADDYDSEPRSNPMSCVLRVSTGSTGSVARVALLAGDIERAQEARLVRDSAAALRADLLLVPHHGSKTSSSEEFLDAVAPRFAVVQAAYRSRYGHPAAPVVQRYRMRGVQLFDTAHCGAERWHSQRPDQLDCQRDADLRYWHHRPGEIGF